MPALFRCIDQSFAGRFPFNDNYGSKVIRAIGTIGVASCLGIYLQINDHECFCAHFTMLPMWSRSLSAMTGDLSLPNREDVNYLKIVHRTKTRLVETCGQFNPEYERTLVLVSRSPCLQTWAMIDGVLAWMGILGSDIVEARKKYHSFDSEIIVERPGDPTGQIDMLSFQDEGDPPLINDPEGDCGYDADRANDAKWQPLRSDENGNSWGNQDYWMNISPPGTPRVEETP